MNSNNARVLTETRFRSASVGDESAIISEYSIRICCAFENLISEIHMISKED